MQNSRNINLDVLRVFACFLVILYHLPNVITHQGIEFYDTSSHLLYVVCLPICRCAVPLFFVISGYLILPVRETTLTFLHKRLLRIICPCVFWWIFYYAFGNEFTDRAYWCGLLSHSPHLWYIWALLGIYFVAPVVSPWLRTASLRETGMYGLLWGCTLGFTLFSNIAPIHLEFNHNGMLYDSPIGALYYTSSYIGYFVLGGVIKQHISSIKERTKWIALYLTTIYGLNIIVAKYVFKCPTNNSMAYLSLPTASLTFLIFISTLKFNLTAPKSIKLVLVSLSKMTYGMYLIHLFVLQKICLNDTIGGYSRFAIAIGVFFISYLIIKITSFLPFSKYIIG